VRTFTSFPTCAWRYCTSMRRLDVVTRCCSVWTLPNVLLTFVRFLRAFTFISGGWIVGYVGLCAAPSSPATFVVTTPLQRYILLHFVCTSCLPRVLLFFPGIFTCRRLVRCVAHSSRRRRLFFVFGLRITRTARCLTLLLRSAVVPSRLSLWFCGLFTLAGLEKRTAGERLQIQKEKTVAGCRYAYYPAPALLPPMTLRYTAATALPPTCYH